MLYVVIKTEGLLKAEVLGKFDSLNEARKLLKEYRDDFKESDLLGDEEDKFGLFGRMGDIQTYQILEIDWGIDLSKSLNC